MKVYNFDNLIRTDFDSVVWFDEENFCYLQREKIDGNRQVVGVDTYTLGDMSVLRIYVGK